MAARGPRLRARPPARRRASTRLPLSRQRSTGRFSEEFALRPRTCAARTSERGNAMPGGPSTWLDVREAVTRGSFGSFGTFGSFGALGSLVRCGLHLPSQRSACEAGVRGSGPQTRARRNDLVIGLQSCNDDEAWGGQISPFLLTLSHGMAVAQMGVHGDTSRNVCGGGDARRWSVHAVGLPLITSGAGDFPRERALARGAAPDARGRRLLVKWRSTVYRQPSERFADRRL
jgi:hypothetical protein